MAKKIVRGVKKGKILRENKNVDKIFCFEFDTLAAKLERERERERMV